MKKKNIWLLLLLIFLTGCGKYSQKDVIKDVNKKLEKTDAYYLSGNLEITNNDDVYNYNIKVSYKKENYRVELTNKSNGHSQIILKNSEGVYILTPSLNKSFKFQSDWPYDNSQIYLIKAILNDINRDKNRQFKKVDDGYLFTTKVNYPNNKNLINQKIEFNKNLNLKKVTVYDKNGVICMEMDFKDINYSPTFDKDYFNLDTIMKDYKEESTVKETGVFDETIYPLFLPNGTKLVDEEKIETNNGNRIIMTFDGDKSFLLVEELATKEDEFTIIPTYGEPYRLMDTLGVMTDNSLSWVSGGVEYYMVSDVLNQDELVEIAQSIYSLPTMK